MPGAQLSLCPTQALVEPGTLGSGSAHQHAPSPAEVERPSPCPPRKPGNGILFQFIPELPP